MSVEDLNISERRSLVLHRAVAEKLNERTLTEWTPLLWSNLEKLWDTVRGEPHRSNVERWHRLVAERDVEAIREVLTSPIRPHVEMREVTPFAGTLTQQERLAALKTLRQDKQST